MFAFFFKIFASPEIVPPVPIPATKISNLPSYPQNFFSGVFVMSKGVIHISELRRNDTVRNSTNSSAFLPLRFHPFSAFCKQLTLPHVLTSFLLLQTLFLHHHDEAIASCAAIIAKPIPVLPEVGSIKTVSC